MRQVIMISSGWQSGVQSSFRPNVCVELVGASNLSLYRRGALPCTDDCFHVHLIGRLESPYEFGQVGTAVLLGKCAGYCAEVLTRHR